MKKMISVRNGVIIALCVAIICMGMGFIVLSVELEKEKKEISYFDVSFSNVSKVSSTKGGLINPDGSVEILKNGKELDMKFTLNVAHDELVYNVTIKNNGTIPAEIVDLMGSPDYSSYSFNNLIDPVTITTNDLIGKELAPGEETDLNISLYYNPSTKTGSRSFNFKLGLITRAVDNEN